MITAESNHGNKEVGILKERIKIIVAILIVEIIVVVVLYSLGFRISYDPNQINDWDAISAVATWISAIATIAIPVVVVLFDHKLNESEKLTGAANKAVLEEFKNFKDQYHETLEALQRGDIILNCGDSTENGTTVTKDEVLKYVRAVINATQYDVAVHFNIETQTAEKLLRRLVEEGKLSRTIVDPSVDVYKYLLK